MLISRMVSRIKKGAGNSECYCRGCSSLKRSFIPPILGARKLYKTAYSKPWTVEEEKQLREMVQAGKSVEVVADALEKTENAVRQKMIKLELKEEKKSCNRFFSSNLELPEDLPSVEDQLKVLAGALDELKTPHLDQADVLRLRSVIQGVKIYKELFADYVDYRGIEAELFEMREKYAELVKKTKDGALGESRASSFPLINQTLPVDDDNLFYLGLKIVSKIVYCLFIARVAENLN